MNFTALIAAEINQLVTEDRKWPWLAKPVDTR